MFDVCVVGGGAAGLSAAIAAARAGAKVTILEKRPHLGKKILASGNGRCNLTNLDMSPAHFVSHDPSCLGSVFDKLTVSQALAFWRGLGLELTSEDGRLYPRTMQARSVLEVLLHELTRLDVSISENSPVAAISAPHNGNALEIVGQGGTRLSARAVVLATGGTAAPQLGCSGDGYSFVTSFGHTVLPPAPALVGLRLSSPYLKLLSGLRLRARVSMPELSREEVGEVIFTDYGISGIPVFDLTAHLGHRAGLALHLRLADQTSLPLLVSFLQDRLHLLRHKTIHNALIGYIPTQLIAPLLHAGGLPLNLLSDQARGRKLSALAALLWDWSFPIVGPNTWDQAQTTWGGVPLCEVEIPSFGSKKHPGLFLAGEILDVHGKCGGYNLHWAFGSGTLAGESAAASVLD